jgi:hypothetical protein
MDEIDLRWLHLKRGRHPRPEIGLCILEAVSAYKGLPHGDCPCILPSGVCEILQVLNDAAKNDQELTDIWRPHIHTLSEFDKLFDESEVYRALEQLASQIQDWYGTSPCEFATLDTSAALEKRGKLIADWIEKSCKDTDVGRDVYTACCEVFQSCLIKA